MSGLTGTPSHSNIYAAKCPNIRPDTAPILGGSAAGQWFHIAPISAGVFGVPAGMAVLVAVSLLTRAPDAHTTGFVDHIRAPE